MIFKAFTQGTLVRERGPEARATGVRCTTRAGGPCYWGALHNAGQRPALLGYVGTSTRARGPRYWGTLVRQRGPEARAPGCVAQRGPEARAPGVRWYVNAGRRPALLGYVGTSTRAGGPRTQGALVRERGPEARAPGCVGT